MTEQQLSLFEDQAITCQCPCCGAQGTLQDLITGGHLSLHDHRTWTGELIACLPQRLAAEAQTLHWKDRPLPEEYKRLTEFNADGSRVLYTYQDVFTDAPAVARPGWRCPTCRSVELSPARLAVHHGVTPGDRSSWKRARCWSTTSPQPSKGNAS